MYKYMEIAKKLENEIYNNYQPGDKFLSEEILCRKYAVNRATIHRALKVIEDNSLLKRKGRAGSFVTDFVNSGFDNRLMVLAMPLKGHMWDKLYIDISCQLIKHEQLIIPIDTTAAAKNENGAEEQMFIDLKKALRLRPRNLIISTEIDLNSFFTQLGSSRRQFRNLICLYHGSDIATCQDLHLGKVCADMKGTWELIVEQAFKSQYSEICIFVPSISKEWDPLQRAVKDISQKHGRTNAATQWFSEENLQESLNGLVDLAKKTKSLAIICTYDFGAHLAVGALRASGIAIPERVGIYGINNTPWSDKDDLTTIDFNLEHWSQSIIECVEKLEKSSRKTEILIPPVFIQRSSTRYLN